MQQEIDWGGAPDINIRRVILLAAVYNNICGTMSQGMQEEGD